MPIFFLSGDIIQAINLYGMNEQSVNRFPEFLITKLIKKI